MHDHIGPFNFINRIPIDHIIIGKNKSTILTPRHIHLKVPNIILGGVNVCQGKSLLKGGVIELLIKNYYARENELHNMERKIAIYYQKYLNRLFKDKFEKHGCKLVFQLSWDYEDEYIEAENPLEIREGYYCLLMYRVEYDHQVLNNREGYHDGGDLEWSICISEITHENAQISLKLYDDIISTNNEKDLKNLLDEEIEILDAFLDDVEKSIKLPVNLFHLPLLNTTTVSAIMFTPIHDFKKGNLLRYAILQRCHAFKQESWYQSLNIYNFKIKSVLTKQVLAFHLTVKPEELESSLTVFLRTLFFYELVDENIYLEAKERVHFEKTDYEKNISLIFNRLYSLKKFSNIDLKYFHETCFSVDRVHFLVTGPVNNNVMEEILKKLRFWVSPYHCPLEIPNTDRIAKSFIKWSQNEKTSIHCAIRFPKVNIGYFQFKVLKHVIESVIENVFNHSLSCDTTYHRDYYIVSFALDASQGHMQWLVEQLADTLYGLKYNLPEQYALGLIYDLDTPEKVNLEIMEYFEATGNFPIMPEALRAGYESVQYEELSALCREVLVLSNIYLCLESGGKRDKEILRYVKNKLAN